MALIDLPQELFDIVIKEVLPESFESLTLTCQTIYKLCAPFIEHHNKLRSHLHNFTYAEYQRPGSVLQNPRSLFPIRTAFDLIACIAIEPVVARYIIHANFAQDTSPLFSRVHYKPNARSRGLLQTLFSESHLLVQAELDWREYYAAIEDDLKQDFPYSQHATVFLLALLPDVKTLALPNRWKSLKGTDKLIDAVVRNSQKTHLHFHKPSLAQVTRVSSSVS